MNAQQRVTRSSPSTPEIPLLQRKCGCGGSCDDCSTKKELRRSARSSQPSRIEAPPIVHEVLRSPGEPLDRATRAAMEPHFGHDFSRVRVHRDERAARSAEAVDAHAYTVGSAVVFGRNEYAPRSTGGARLLAHELAHVVQQRHAIPASAASLEVGDAHDALERDAEAQSAVELAVPRVQRSVFGAVLGAVVGGLKDALLFIPRLFGAGGYSDNELADYLKGLKKSHAIEDSIFSDNKARGCVDADDEKRLTALGAPYDLEVKQLLVQEMMTGFTSFLDERAIIRLLRRQGNDERQKIVGAVNRSKLWSKFSGGNQRILEALTLTAADANDALVARLQNLSPDELQDYVANAVDPDVQKQVQKVVRLKAITTPVPASAAVDESGVATFKVGDTDIRVEPDENTADEQYRGFAYTGIKFVDAALEHHTDTTTTNVTSFTVTPPRTTVLIKTVYGPDFGPKDPPAYGRGTTSTDVAERHTTAGFHEGRHGLDLLDYVGKHPVPQFDGQTGVPLAELMNKWKDYTAARQAYTTAAQLFSARQTDCAGDKKIPPDVLTKFGMPVTLCETK